MTEPLTEAEDILLLWQSLHGPLDEEIREEFLYSEIVEELRYFHINVIHNALLAKNVRLKDILTYAYVHPYVPGEKGVDPSFEYSEPDVGAHLLEGTLYSVRRDRKTDQIQVWEFNPTKKEYRRPFFSAEEHKILQLLGSGTKLTLRLAQKYSIETGICCHCGRYLSAKKSVASGMGPICKKYYH